MSAGLVDAEGDEMTLYDWWALVGVIFFVVGLVAIGWFPTEDFKEPVGYFLLILADLAVAVFWPWLLTAVTAVGFCYIIIASVKLLKRKYQNEQP
jgi:uncharacterized protein YggT (Ycf19 family)